MLFDLKDFTDQGRIGEPTRGYGVKFVVLNWYLWELCCGVLYCTTRKDKLNVLLLFTSVSMSWCDHDTTTLMKTPFKTTDLFINVNILVRLCSALKRTVKPLHWSSVLLNKATGGGGKLQKSQGGETFCGSESATQIHVRVWNFSSSNLEKSTSFSLLMKHAVGVAWTMQ